VQVKEIQRHWSPFSGLAMAARPRIAVEILHPPQQGKVSFQSMRRLAAVKAWASAANCGFGLSHLITERLPSFGGIAVAPLMLRVALGLC
jgi:hypothetical protein